MALIDYQVFMLKAKTKKAKDKIKRICLKDKPSSSSSSTDFSFAFFCWVLELNQPKNLLLKLHLLHAKKTTRYDVLQVALRAFQQSP